LELLFVKENQAATKFSCLFRKARIEQPTYSTKFLGKKKLNFFFVNENQVTTRILGSFRRRRIGQLFDFQVRLEKGELGSHPTLFTTYGKNLIFFFFGKNRVAA